MKAIIVSIGCFTIEEIQKMELAEKDCCFYYYDPNLEVFKKFHAAFKYDDAVHIYSEAVSWYDGQHYFYLNGQASSLTEIQNSEHILVHVTELKEILESLDSKYEGDPVKFLCMNCEGEEISIILNTSIKELLGFKRIQIEFHPRLYSESSIDACITKLKPFFDVIKKYGTESNHPRFQFIRKS